MNNFWFRYFQKRLMYGQTLTFLRLCQIFFLKSHFIYNLLKELSFCHKLWFSNSDNLTTRFPRPLIFQTINSVRLNSLSLKYQRFTPSRCLDIGVRKCEFVAKTQFLYRIYLTFFILIKLLFNLILPFLIFYSKLIKWPNPCNNYLFTSLYSSKQGVCMGGV